MKTAIINTFDLAGGAARAAHRLHNALKGNAVDSSMVVMSKQSLDSSVLETGGYASDENIGPNYIIHKLVQRYHINSHRTELSNTSFSFAYPGRDISLLPLIQSADLINLHWIAFYQTPVTVKKLMKLGKPIVWTLHDMYPFTGGCHYSAGCDGYTKECMDCPQLSNDPYSLPNAILKDKLALFADFPLTIVSPSKWLAGCASKSALFSNCRIEVIPNCIETDIYTPMPKKGAKTAFGINPQNIVLMFGADSSNEKRKGFAELEVALTKARANPLIEDYVLQKSITILTLGPLTAEMSNLGFDVKALGHIIDDALISQSYSAADIFLLPSLEDNLPNMMLEAMACGTPVLAFNTGGIPDVVKDGVNGMVVPVGDVDALADRLVELFSDEALRDHLGAESAAYVHAAYTPKIQADRYTELFTDLLENSKSKSWSVKRDSEICLSGNGSDAEFGPGFNAIRHKVMLDVLLKAIPEICHATPVGHSDLQMAKAAQQAAQAENDLNAFKSSLSWRITKPLRWLGGWLVKAVKD